MMSRTPLENYLSLKYPFNVIPDPEGGYVVVFPDLPGCMTQVETAEEILSMAEEIRTLWLETEYERGADIPLPSYSEEYSGKFNLRLPRSLHRKLAESARTEDVSLNQYVVMLLSRGDAQAQLERHLQVIHQTVQQIDERLSDPNVAIRWLLSTPGLVGVSAALTNVVEAFNSSTRTRSDLKLK